MLIRKTLYIIGAKKIGVNPKINNMAQGYDAAKYDHILISDSGVKSKSFQYFNITL